MPVPRYSPQSPPVESAQRQPAANGVPRVGRVGALGRVAGVPG